MATHTDRSPVFSLFIEDSFRGTRSFGESSLFGGSRPSHGTWLRYYGTEFTANHFDAWAYDRRVFTDFIAPGKPVQNGFIESFNGKLRDECLNANWLSDLEHAQRLLDAWVADYNELRPHSALDNLRPLAYLARLTGFSEPNLTNDMRI